MKIIFLDAASLGDSPLDPIARLGTLVCYPNSTPAEAIGRVADADILIVNKVRVTAELIDAAPKLKLICEAATGVNNIDLDAAAQRGIPVRNVAGYSTDTVAQLVFTQILYLTCNPSRYDAEIKDGSYSRSCLFTDVRSPYSELSGKTMGIIGMGTIGSRVAAIATAFGMKVIYFSTSGTSHCKDYPSVSLQELLGNSDIVSIHAPLNERTKGLLGTDELAMMKSDALLVNMARGGIVDEKAVSDAVGSGMIGGAAFDTFTVEPLPEDNPLLHCSRPERLMLTPHVAWRSREAVGRLVAGIAKNIEEFLA